MNSQSSVNVFGRCEECQQDNTGYIWWCNPCNSKRFEGEFGKWTSGNKEIDRFIQEAQLEAKNYKEFIEWIPYDKFQNIEFLARGGFGEIFKATWIGGYIKSWNHKNQEWKRSGREELVCLKRLDNSAKISNDFFQEVRNQLQFTDDAIQIYGITEDTEKCDYAIVMKYAPGGSLRQMLDKKYIKLYWHTKLSILESIIGGLANIHRAGLVHKDFHSGNILFSAYNSSFIADFGLCKPVSQESSSENVFGVLPYVAPEVLKGKEYTTASDVYSFGILMTELFTGYPPFHDQPHDGNLALQICHGLRPAIRCQVPQLLLDLINECLDAEVSKRPSAERLKDIIYTYREELNCMKDTEIVRQIISCEESAKDSSAYDPSKTTQFNYTTHAQAIYTSKLLDFEGLPDPTNAIAAEQLEIELPSLNDLTIEDDDEDQD